MSIKGYSAFPKAPVLLEADPKIGGGVLPPSKIPSVYSSAPIGWAYKALGVVMS